MLLMRGEGETTDGSIPAFTSGGMEIARCRGSPGGGTLKGGEGGESGQVGEVVVQLWQKMANGEVLTHQSDISESVTAGPKGRDGM